MRDFADKTAFITGGASGIGLALGRAFAEAGMKVMLADVEAGALDKALQSLSNHGNRMRGIQCDVGDPDSVERAAQATFDAFGNVHVVCNNAGVAAGGGIDNISIDNWRWVVDVNLMGVVYGVRSFLPQMLKHREGGHIVNTASMAGMINGIGFSPYVATKFAVVSMSEGLAMQLQPHGIGVSVLCPEYVRTRIGESGRNRPSRYGASPPLIRRARPPRCWPRSQEGSRPASIRERSRRRFSTRSGTSSFTSSPIRTCVGGWTSGLPRSRPRWTG